ncbi:MAG: N-acetyl-alpha-D-glucosaminyl L-malate synthase BshA [Candidatus Heimdallarchaeota archaeon]|nr:N-acetyl-alpha-D-glucosaminyl L-malate synthase BshA [Candidatus Heimdallarchaeota archaeon]
MKILMTGFPTMGGSGMITTRLGIELANLGHDVHFLFYKRPFFLRDNDNQENITFHQVDRSGYALFSEIGSPYTIQAASKMVEIVKKEQVDIVHSHYAIPHSVASYLASKMVDMTTVVTTHGSDTHTLGAMPGYNPTISLALKGTDKVTSVSEYLARETERIFDLKPNSVPVIYDFVNTDYFVPFNGEKELSITQASNFREIKQVPLLVEYFAEVAHEFPDWKLKLIGDGPEISLATRRARELGIRSQVEFLGVQKDINQLFAKSSILASTSMMESFGLTIAEAMSCEVPIWAPNVGGIPELCDDGNCGYLYNFNERELAIEKLRKLMGDEKRREEMGRLARKRIIERFSIPIIIKQYEELYKDLLNH